MSTKEEFTPEGVIEEVASWNICGICGKASNQLTVAAPKDESYDNAKLCMLDELISRKKGFLICGSCNIGLNTCVDGINQMVPESIGVSQQKMCCFVCGTGNSLLKWKGGATETDLVLFNRIRDRIGFENEDTETICMSCRVTFLNLFRMHLAVRRTLEKSEQSLDSAESPSLDSETEVDFVPKTISQSKKSDNLLTLCSILKKSNIKEGFNEKLKSSKRVRFEDEQNGENCGANSYDQRDDVFNDFKNKESAKQNDNTDTVEPNVRVLALSNAMSTLQLDHLTPAVNVTKDTSICDSDELGTSKQDNEGVKVGKQLPNVQSTACPENRCHNYKGQLPQLSLQEITSARNAPIKMDDSHTSCVKLPKLCITKKLEDVFSEKDDRTMLLESLNVVASRKKLKSKSVQTEQVKASKSTSTISKRKRKKLNSQRSCLTLPAAKEQTHNFYSSINSSYDSDSYRSECSSESDNSRSSKSIRKLHKKYNRKARQNLQKKPFTGDEKGKYVPSKNKSEPLSPSTLNCFGKMETNQGDFVSWLRNVTDIWKDINHFCTRSSCSTKHGAGNLKFYKDDCTSSDNDVEIMSQATKDYRKPTDCSIHIPLSNCSPKRFDRTGNSGEHHPPTLKPSNYTENNGKEVDIKTDSLQSKELQPIQSPTTENVCSINHRESNGGIEANEKPLKPTLSLPKIKQNLLIPISYPSQKRTKSETIITKNEQNEDGQTEIATNKSTEKKLFCKGTFKMRNGKSADNETFSNSSCSEADCDNINNNRCVIGTATNLSECSRSKVISQSTKPNILKPRNKKLEIEDETSSGLDVKESLLQKNDSGYDNFPNIKLMEKNSKYIENNGPVLDVESGISANKHENVEDVRDKAQILIDSWLEEMKQSSNGPEPTLDSTDHNEICKPNEKKPARTLCGNIASLLGQLLNPSNAVDEEGLETKGEDSAEGSWLSEEEQTQGELTEVSQNTKFNFLTLKPHMRVLEKDNAASEDEACSDE